MLFCALGFSRGTWWVLSKNKCPASISGRCALRKLRSSPLVCDIPKDLAMTK